MEATVIPSIWAPLRVDFFIGMIIAQIIYIPFSQGLPFVVLATLILQAFSGARLGLIPLLYIAAFLAMDVIKNLVYLENSYSQMVLGACFALALSLIAAFLTDIAALEGTVFPMIVGAVFSGLVSPAMVYIVCRLQIAYEQ